MPHPGKRNGKAWIPSHSMVVWYKNSCDGADRSCVLEVWVNGGIQKVSRICTEHSLQEQWSMWFCDVIHKKKSIEIPIAMIPPLFFFLCWIHVSQKMWRIVTKSHLPARCTVQHNYSILLSFFQLPGTSLYYLLNGFLIAKRWRHKSV